MTVIFLSMFYLTIKQRSSPSAVADFQEVSQLQAVVILVLTSNSCIKRSITE